jgi:hypothetical protein
VSPYDDDDDDARCDCLGAQDVTSDDSCAITIVFGQLMQIKGDPNCQAGCADGTGACPADWYPGGADICSAECGLVFEPFCTRFPTPARPCALPAAGGRTDSRPRCASGTGDSCGTMLTNAHMGGMDEMGLFCESPLLIARFTCGAHLRVCPDRLSPVFLQGAWLTLVSSAVCADDHCLETLYPPGSCGFVCNTHTYDCYVGEIAESCCDEGGRNCPADHDVPIECQVGCAIVFPEFFETCHDHVADNADMDEHDFATFESQCLDQEGLALVEYALNLQESGCIIDLSGDGTAGRRQLQSGSYLTQYLGTTAPTCNWDDLDDLADEVDSICCGADGSLCASSNGVIAAPRTCSPSCALAMHHFSVQCGTTLATILGADDARNNDIMTFEQRCLDEADPHFFLEAIMHADCSDAENKGR